MNSVIVQGNDQKDECVCGIHRSTLTWQMSSFQVTYYLGIMVVEYSDTLWVKQFSTVFYECVTDCYVSFGIVQSNSRK